MNHEWSLYTNSVLLLYHPYLDRIMNQNLWESKIVSHRYFIFLQPNQPYDFFPTRFIRMIAAKFWALCQNTFVVHYSHRIRAPKKGYYQRYPKCFGPFGQISQNSCEIIGVVTKIVGVCCVSIFIITWYAWTHLVWTSLPLSLRHHASIVRD